MIVLKFGGSSVADRAQLDKVFDIVGERLDRRPIVVCSAHKGMTDALVQAAKSAAKKEFALPDVIDLQSEIAESLGCPAKLLKPFYTEISDLLRGISLVRELSPRSLDYISSFGERMSVRVIADYFSRKGIPSKAFDVWDLGFITDSNFGRARPVHGYQEEMCKAFDEKVAPDVLPVVTGFVGMNANGDITTVGRNGSDLTAALIAAALNAEEVEIWTDTDGVMTADPSVVPNARNIPAMRFDEAAELAYFGSRVLHPSTLEPAMRRNIPVRVLNTNRPSHPGTVISENGGKAKGRVTSIAYKESQWVLTITSTRMLRKSGFLAQIFGVMGRHGVVVDVISTSEISVSISSESVDALHSAMTELEEYGQCELNNGKTVLVVVGRNLAQRHGQASQILKAMTDGGAGLQMLSFGMGSINLSMVIDDQDIRTAVPLLHKILFEED